MKNIILTIALSVITSLLVFFIILGKIPKPDTKRLETLETRLDMLANVVVNLNYQLDVMAESMRQ